MIFIDLLLYSEETTTDVNSLLEKHASNLGYIEYLPSNYKKIVVQLAAVKKKVELNGITYTIWKGQNKKWNLNLKLFLYLRNQKPNIILVHSFIYAWQILFLRLIISSKTKIIVQNHAEKPFGYKKRWIQKIAAKGIFAFLFVSKEQADPWIKAGIIKSRNEVFEVMEGSTNFTEKDKFSARKSLNFKGKTLFLWVGRLDKNKDPLTILHAYNSYTKHNKDVMLWMVYSTTDLLDEVKEFIRVNNLLQHVELLGEIEHSELEVYYNAADYFILGSHYEGSGYALCEAMACGCVPIVTKIPSFEKMLNKGECGYLFEPGNTEELTKLLLQLDEDKLPYLRQLAIEKFKTNLSFQAIGGQITKILLHTSK